MPQIKVRELDKHVFEKMYKVYEVFKDFFGEEFTDMQNVPILGLSTQDLRLLGFEVLTDSDGDTAVNLTDAQLASLQQRYHSRNCDILVYWPKVTVSNESGKSTDIRELYAQIRVNAEGRIPYEHCGFRLNRTRYNVDEWISGYNGRGYMHSHIPCIPKHDLTEFQQPCLGSGPINNTIMELKGDFDETEWMLFCQELSMYVTVESLRGGPYMRLEEIGSRRAMPDYQDFSFDAYGNPIQDHRYFFNKRRYKEFIDYYLENGHLTFDYSDGYYKIGMSFYEFIIDISNAFIEFFNQLEGISVSLENLYQGNLLMKSMVVDGKFYYYSSGDRNQGRDLNDYIGKHVCYFKGQNKTLAIDGNRDTQAVVTNLLNARVAMHIYNKILKVLNFRYQNGTSQNPGPAASVGQNVRYL